MNTLLADKDLQDIVDEGYKKPIDWISLAAYAKKNTKEDHKKISFALYHLQSTLK